MNFSSSMGSHRTAGGKGISTAAFLNKLESGENDSEQMYMEESIVGMEEESHLTKVLRNKLAEIREEMAEYLILKGVDDIDSSLVPPAANIILFGPSGSGKSSVIRTVYSAVSGSFKLPKEISDQLLIKRLSGNEGTTKFTKIEVKPPKTNVVKSGGISYEYKVSGISMFDTRGQVLLNEKEREALNLMLEVYCNNQGSCQNQLYDRESKLSIFISSL